MVWCQGCSCTYAFLPFLWVCFLLLRFYFLALGVFHEVFFLFFFISSSFSYERCLVTVGGVSRVLPKLFMKYSVSFFFFLRFARSFLFFLLLFFRSCRPRFCPCYWRRASASDQPRDTPPSRPPPSRTSTPPYSRRGSRDFHFWSYVGGCRRHCLFLTGGSSFLFFGASGLAKSGAPKNRAFRGCVNYVYFLVRRARGRAILCVCLSTALLVGLPDEIFCR